MKAEIWKNIDGYIGIYQISNRGRVKSLSRIKYCGKRKANGTRYKEKILKNNKDNYGYQRVNLWKNNKCKMVKIHKLVADCFIIKHPLLTDINHKNGIKTDNRLENLERTTRSKNLRHAYSLGLKVPYWKNKLGKLHPVSVGVMQLDVNGIKLKIWDSQTEASRNTGIGQGCISSACRGYQKTAGGYKWEYLKCQS